MSLGVERLWRRREELKAEHKGLAPYRSRCNGVIARDRDPKSTSTVISEEYCLLGFEAG
jgi:hypothetical protein